MPSGRTIFLAGIRAELPILVGVAPFGLIYGVLARDAGLSVTQAQAMSSVVFAGSAQFAMAQLIGDQVPALVVVVTGAILNVRHALYSASVAPYLLKLNRRWRWGLAYLLTDEAYAVAITYFRARGNGAGRHWYLLGAGMALWTIWQLSTAAGIVLGAQVPADWRLDFALALSFIALVVPTLEDRASVAAALASGLAALLFFKLPLNLGLLAAAVVGIVAGILVEKGQSVGTDPPPPGGSGERFTGP